MTEQRELSGVTQSSLLENLKLRRRLVGGGGSSFRRRGWACGAGQACFQGILAQILTWATESALLRHQPILWKGLEKLSNLFRITYDLLVAVGSMWFPFPFLIPGISGKCYFRFSFGSEALFCYFSQMFCFPSSSSPLDSVREPRCGV